MCCTLAWEARGRVDVGAGAVPYKVISGKRWRGQKDNIKTQMQYIIYRGVYSVLLTYFGFIISALKPDVSLVALSQRAGRPATFHTTTCQ